MAVLHTCEKFLFDGYTALDKRGCQVNIFLVSPQKCGVGTQRKCLGEVRLMSNHNICFHGEIRKKIIFFWGGGGGGGRGRGEMPCLELCFTIPVISLCLIALLIYS